MWWCFFFTVSATPAPMKKVQILAHTVSMAIWATIGKFTDTILIRKPTNGPLITSACFSVSESVLLLQSQRLKAEGSPLSYFKNPYPLFKESEEFLIWTSVRVRKALL